MPPCSAPMPEKGSSVRWQRDLMRCLGATLVAGMGHLALAGIKDVPGSLGVGNRCRLIPLET